MVEAQKAGIRVLLCGTIPDPKPTVDAKLKLLDDALRDLDMGPGNRFIELRHLLFENKKVCLNYYRKGDIHLSEEGVKVVGHRIRQMLEIMLQTPAVQVQAPVVVQTAAVQTPAVQFQPPVVNAPPVVHTPAVQTAVVQPPVQQLIGQVQDLVIQHVTVPDHVESPMEIEDEDEILQKLFFKKFGRALPEVGVRNEVDEINFVIDLTDKAEMESNPEAVPVPLPIIVKTEPTEVVKVAKVAHPNAAKVATDRKERREFAKFAKAAKIFAKTLPDLTNPIPAPKTIRKTMRKSIVISEKEAPEIVTDTNMPEDRSVEQVKAVESEMEADQKAFEEEFGHIEDEPAGEPDEFDEGDLFQLYPGSDADKDDVIDAEEAMIDDI
jgi:hypothetical protein